MADKSGNRFELTLYEALGVRQFRALVFKLERFNHRKDKGKNINYHIAAPNVGGMDAFIKYFFYNGAIHVRNILVLILYFGIKLAVSRQFTLRWYDIFTLLLLTKDIYCVMLQRYNFLRIKEKQSVLRRKRQAWIEREARKIDTSAYNAEEKQRDLDFIRKMRDSIENHKSVVIRPEDMETLRRLSGIMKTRTISIENGIDI